MRGRQQVAQEGVGAEVDTAVEGAGVDTAVEGAEVDTAVEGAGVDALAGAEARSVQ